MSTKPKYIVKVDGFDGADFSIDVRDYELYSSNAALYCIAVPDPETGVLEFVDYGYRTIEEARAAWPEAL